MLSYVLSRDKIAVWLDDDKIIKRDLQCCPIALRNTNSIDEWLADREIDRKCINARLLKKVFRITDKNDKEIVLYNNAVQ